MQGSCGGRWRVVVCEIEAKGLSCASGFNYSHAGDVFVMPNAFASLEIAWISGRLRCVRPASVFLFGIAWIFGVLRHVRPVAVFVFEVVWISGRLRHVRSGALNENA